MKRLLIPQAAAALVAVTFVGVARDAGASIQTYGFTAISNNSGQSAAVATQLFVDVLDAAEASTAYGLTLSGDVLFVFRNAVGIASNVAEVYFDDGTLMGQTGLHNSLGGFTNFGDPPIDPANLPGGNTVSPAFVATAAFGADVANGPPTNGINAASDLLGIEVDLLDGLDWGDTIAAIADGSLRFGLHVRSIGTSGGSDGFVNTGGPGGGEIPEAASLAVWALLAGGVGLLKLRARRVVGC